MFIPKKISNLQKLKNNLLINEMGNGIYKREVNVISFKDPLSDLKKILATENPLKLIKNALDFTLIAFFVLKISEFLF